MYRLLVTLTLFFLLPTNLLASEQMKRSQLLMGNVLVTLTIEDRSSKKESAYTSMSEAFEEARRVEKAVSEWQPESQTSQLNQNAGKRMVPIGSDLMKILLEANEISTLTHGAFDITFPSKKSGITYQDIVLWPEFSLAYLPSGVKIGVSGIAKGYIVDRMVDILQKNGFKKFLVDAGDLYGRGSWTIGIRDPKAPSSENTICHLKIKNQAVSTSGLYERGPHIIDPKTHQVPRALSSITVVSDHSVFSDALATGLFVLAGREGVGGVQKVISSQKNIGALWLSSESNISQTGRVSSDCK